MRLHLIIVVFALLIIAPAIAQDAPERSAESGIAPLRVWLPAPLISDESSASYQLLDEHRALFSQNNGVAVEFRIKEIGKVGGIMATIRAGSEVAPGALPDVALIRGRDFTPTQAQQYLQSMESLFSSALINDLANGLALGQIALDDGAALYGLPYFFDLLLAVSNAPSLADGLSFDEVLASGASFRFPAARANGLNQTFYLQYLAADSSLSGGGDAVPDEAALLEILEFYGSLRRDGNIGPEVLAYQTSASYRSDFLSERESPQVAVFTASEYLEMLAAESGALFAGGIPTASGARLSIRDGWLWALVTPDHSRQAVSARFLEWMMEPDFHAAFSKALYHLPSQPAALASSLPDAVDKGFFADLLADAALPLPEAEGGSAPRLMQEALAQVLQDEADASAAARHVVEQLAER